MLDGSASQNIDRKIDVFLLAVNYVLFSCAVMRAWVWVEDGVDGYTTTALCLCIICRLSLVHDQLVLIFLHEVLNTVSFFIFSMRCDDMNLPTSGWMIHLPKESKLIFWIHQISDCTKVFTKVRLIRRWYHKWPHCKLVYVYSYLSLD